MSEPSASTTVKPPLSMALTIVSEPITSPVSIPLRLSPGMIAPVA